MGEDEAGRHSERSGAAGGCGPEKEAWEATSRALGGSGRLRAAGAPAVAKVAVSRPPSPAQGPGGALRLPVLFLRRVLRRLQGLGPTGAPGPSP